MDNQNYIIRFENGNEVTVRYDPYAPPIHRGRRESDLVLDEFSGIEDFSEPLIDTFNSIQTGYMMNREQFLTYWNLADEYEFSFKDGRLEMKKRNAPDFGEISPSQELNDFVNTLVRGE